MMTLTFNSAAAPVVSAIDDALRAGRQNTIANAQNSRLRMAGNEVYLGRLRGALSDYAGNTTDQQTQFLQQNAYDLAEQVRRVSDLQRRGHIAAAAEKTRLDLMITPAIITRDTSALTDWDDATAYVDSIVNS